MLHSQRHPPAPGLFLSNSQSPPENHSAHSSRSGSPTGLRPSELQALNGHLGTLEPIEVLDWAVDHLPGLYQTTAFGLTGCAIVGLFASLRARRRAAQPLIDLIFLDTLYHFPETVELAHRLVERYELRLHTFYPPGATTATEFEALLGPKLWETDQLTYDFLTKVEPARRAYEELGVQAVVTGRRRSQGGERTQVSVLEIDETGLVKVNPLASWTWDQTWEYVKKENVPYNSLLDAGYRSIGDWHSTAAPKPGETMPADERAGRWRGSEKTECGLHQDYFKLKLAFEKRQQEIAPGSH